MFKVCARTVLELGSELISSDIIAFYELIKNGFDAGTKSGVEIRFNIVLRKNAFLRLKAKISGGNFPLKVMQAEAIGALQSDAPKASLNEFEEQISSAEDLEELLACLESGQQAFNWISISDSGTGMSIDDLEKNFLTIGTPSRKKEVDKALRSGSNRSPFLGEKGIGRLSTMRLGNRLKVETARPDDTRLNLLEIDWRVFSNIDSMLNEIEITPKKGGQKSSSNWSGTKIVIGDLTEEWTEQKVRQMADDKFSKLSDPFLDQKDRPRIAIYWNDQRISIAWLEKSLLEHAHASVKGEYLIKNGAPSLHCTIQVRDLGFDHPPESEEVNLKVQELQGVLIGDSEKVNDEALVTVGPFSFEAYWYNRRRLSSIDGTGEKKSVRDQQEKWSGVLLYRDGFRVFPYGEDDDDWLGLDRKALARSGYTLNKTQFVGRVQISRTSNPELVDQTNREGIRENPEQSVFIDLIQHVIQDHLFRFLKHVEKQYKEQKIDLSEAKSVVNKLTVRVNTAIKRLKKITPAKDQGAIEDLQQVFFEFSEFAEKAKQRIKEVEDEGRQMIEMAGVGLMIEVVAHELARASENALKALDSLRRKEVPEDIRGHLESLRAEMKSLSKRVRILDPLSVSGRQRFEVFSLEDLIADTLEAHVSQFKRHNIQVEKDFPKKTRNVRAVKGMIVQILENLISNSKYWLGVRAKRDLGFKPKIRITVSNNPSTIIFEDNGQGVAPENREKIFRPYFSLKEKEKRRGLGLFIARECAEYHGGTLILDDQDDSETGRLHRFILEIPAKAEQP